MKIGDQIVEQIQAHEALPDAQARERVVELLERVGHPARAGADRLLPVRVLGRHAPARDDRHGPLVRPERPDRRRAHHRARRDDPGADPRAHPPAARGDQRRGDPRDARPRRGGRHRRPDRGDVRRPDRRGGHARRHLLRPAAPLHVGPARIDHAGRPAAPRAASRDRRAASVAGRPAGGLPLPPALPARVRQVHAGAAARGARAGDAGHLDRCWLTVEQKRQLREVRPGEIGLPTKEGVAV